MTSLRSPTSVARCTTMATGEELVGPDGAGAGAAADDDVRLDGAGAGLALVHRCSLASGALCALFASRSPRRRGPCTFPGSSSPGGSAGLAAAQPSLPLPSAFFICLKARTSQQGLGRVDVGDRAVGGVGERGGGLLPARRARCRTAWPAGPGRSWPSRPRSRGAPAGARTAPGRRPPRSTPPRPGRRSRRRGAGTAAGCAWPSTPGYRCSAGGPLNIASSCLERHRRDRRRVEHARRAAPSA